MEKFSQVEVTEMGRKFAILVQFNIQEDMNVIQISICLFDICKFLSEIYERSRPIQPYSVRSRLILIDPHITRSP